MENYKLDFTSYVPLYQQLKDLIVNEIQSGKWNPGDKIYSENQLYNMFNVSRNTVQKAIDDLEQEDVLTRIQGKGTFVNKPKIKQSLSKFYSFSQVLTEKGLKPKDIILSITVEKPGPRVAQALDIRKGNEIVVLKRLRCANDEPIILESSYLNKESIHDVNKLEDVGRIPLYNLLQEEFGLKVQSAKESFEPVLIHKEEGKHLGVGIGSPALFLERIAYDDSMKPIEFCTSIVRGDRCKFYTELM